MGFLERIGQYGAGHPWSILAAIAVLAVYMLLAKRIRYLPALPLGLLILYLGLRLLSVQLRGFAWFEAKRWFVETAGDVVLAWAVARLVFELVVEYPYRFKTKKPLTRITRDFILLTCYLILAVIVLGQTERVDLAGLITTSAVLTAVIGFAAQTTLSSFFAGLILQIENPFNIGDWIRYKDQVGQVLGITWKSTQLLTRENVVIYIPNTELTSESFWNYSQPDEKVISRMELGVDYGAAPNKVRRVVLEVLSEHTRVLHKPEPEVRPVRFGDFAITYEIRFATHDFAHEPLIKSELNNQLWYALRRENIRIPFPIRDVQLAHVERRREAAEEAALRADVARLFSEIPVFAPLSDEDREYLVRGVRVERYGTGETIVHEGDEGASLYVIHTGRCQVWKRQRARAKRIATMGKGDFFGEMSLLTGAPRSATVRAAADTTVVVVSKAAFSEVLNASPEISTQLGEILAERQRGQAEGPESTQPAINLSRRIISRIRTFFGIR